MSLSAPRKALNMGLARAKAPVLRQKLRTPIESASRLKPNVLPATATMTPWLITA